MQSNKSMSQINNLAYRV